eukprot:CAMPEP_0168583188 /NCGR_PEP_ID=MMETSP0420-20121227/2419_1 /TAXON_ID=498008 /ORGANISM="Pessonella sp." /LENGTH=139 /DNA_ID=CAMNT_0008617799 /DNA_START=387 /DNA_END=803 /DNA_ORIENTATION=+
MSQKSRKKFVTPRKQTATSGTPVHTPLSSQNTQETPSRRTLYSTPLSKHDSIEDNEIDEETTSIDVMLARIARNERRVESLRADLNAAGCPTSYDDRHLHQLTTKWRSAARDAFDELWAFAVKRANENGVEKPTALAVL